MANKKKETVGTDKKVGQSEGLAFCGAKSTELVAQEQGFSKLANVDMANIHDFSPSAKNGIGNAKGVFAFPEHAADIFRSLMAEELDGLDASFERIKIPSAGSTVYEVPGEDPSESEAVKEFSAVILFHHPLMAYYKEKYTGGNNPPDCGSFDGITGEGDPGGNCKKCPYNQFGSGENNAKACKNRRRIYLIREGEIFPLLLSLPTGSLKEFTKYIKRLLGKGRKSNSVVTRFSLKKATNSGGLAYSQAQFAVDRPLTPEEFSNIDRMSEQVKEYSKSVAFDYDSAEEIDEIPMENIDPETGEIIKPLNGGR